MSCVVAIPPYAEPVSLAEMKLHLKQESSVTEDDEVIRAQIMTARSVVETATGANTCKLRTLMATTYDLTLGCFPYLNYIQVPRVPLVSVSSITYVDTAGDTQTLATTVYSVNIAEGRIYLAYNQTWPSLRGSIEDRVTVRFVAGMAASFTAVASTDIFTALGRSFTVGDRVRLMNSGGLLPGGLSAATDYFVIAGPKLSLTSGGSAVDITTAGTQTHFIIPGTVEPGDFEAARSAIKLRMTALYRNRGDGGPKDENTERAIDALVASIHA